MVDIRQFFQKHSSASPQVVQLRRYSSPKMGKILITGHLALLSIFGIVLPGNYLSYRKCLYMKLKPKTSSNRCMLQFLPTQLKYRIFLSPNIQKSRSPESLDMAVNSLL